MQDDLIRALHHALDQAFKPQTLVIDDEGHLHHGHHAHTQGLRHLHVIIQSNQFDTQSTLISHRQIYQVAAPWMPSPIHALRISIQRDQSSTEQRRHRDQ